MPGKDKGRTVPETSVPERAGRSMGRLRPAVLAGILVLVPVLAGCTAEGGPSPTGTIASIPATGGTMPDAPSTSAPLETTQSSNKASVYWIGRSGGENFLFPGIPDVPGQEKPGTPAPRAMMSGKAPGPDL